MLEDGSVVSSHDKDWNDIADHANYLLPHNNKKWLIYSLVRQDGFYVAVNFQNGLFNINGQIVRVADENGDVMTDKEDPQEFSASESWNVLNGLPYFPIVGRLQFKGSTIDATVYYCGWKRMVNGKRYDRIINLYPDKSVVIQ